MKGVIMKEQIEDKIESVKIGDKVKQTTKKIKIHIQENQKVYVGIGCGLIVGYSLRGATRIVVAPMFNNVPVFNNTNAVNMGGHTTKLVECLETGETWKKVTEAAEAAGVPLARMSRHVNGHNPHLNGRHYQIIGVGTTG
jgi:hypothetical protein